MQACTLTRARTHEDNECIATYIAMIRSLLQNISLRIRKLVQIMEKYELLRKILGLIIHFSTAFWCARFRAKWDEKAELAKRVRSSLLLSSFRLSLPLTSLTFPSLPPLAPSIPSRSLHSLHSLPPSLHSLPFSLHSLPPSLNSFQPSLHSLP